MAGELRRVLSELERNGCRPIVAVSHPRSGTHLCIDTLRLNFAECDAPKRWFEPADRLYLSLDHICGMDRSRAARLVRQVMGRAPRPIVKTHALPDLSLAFERGVDRVDPELGEWLRHRATWLYVYRDGRDTLCSFHRFWNIVQADAPVGLSQFLRQRDRGVSRVRAWADHVESWLMRPDIYGIKMEELLTGPGAIMSGLAEKLGLAWKENQWVRPPPGSRAFLCRLKRRIVRRPASTAILPASAHDHAIAWREGFTPADRAFFNHESDDLIIKLGYEESNQWAQPIPNEPPAARAVCCAKA